MVKEIKVGDVTVGGGAPVSVQSMTNTKTEDVAATIAQIDRLCAAGCDIVRVAVPNEAAARAIEKIKENVSAPIVADIHFDYKLAILSAEAGADKIRINPGNIGGDDRVKAVTDACRAHNIPIRIGVNSGSVEKKLLQKYGGPTPEAMVMSAMGHVDILNRFDFDDICISVKASNVPDTIAAYRLMREKCSYPLHLGVTEAGTEYTGIIKSAAGIGTLLSEGIGDTIRVSLTAPPEREVKAGIELLKALGLRSGGVEFISCPSCGRCKIDLISTAQQVERELEGFKGDITVAVMGCAVNGPGEASRADYGIAGGDGEGVIFKKGQVVKKVKTELLVSELMKLIMEGSKTQWA
jgi:(E)-4-hydroxy-3-methylbut-2-enyl-diphosphate synthase